MPTSVFIFFGKWLIFVGCAGRWLVLFCGAGKFRVARNVDGAMGPCPAGVDVRDVCMW